MILLFGYRLSTYTFTKLIFPGGKLQLRNDNNVIIISSYHMAPYTAYLMQTP